MTAFTKENLLKDGDCVRYAPTGNPYGEDSCFIARFKYSTEVNMGPFMTFLRRNFTVEEWLSGVENGESPLTIAEKKGFVLQHIKHWLRRDGFPETQEGFNRWMEKQAELRHTGYHASESIKAGLQLDDTRFYQKQHSRRSK